MTCESYAFRPFHKKIKKISKSPEIAPNEVEIEKKLILWNQTVNTIIPGTDRSFSHVNTVIKNFYEFHYYKYIVDWKNVCIEAKIALHVEHR